MFLEFKDYVVNLDNCVSALFETKKIVFNFNYSVSLKSNVDKYVPDYVYIFADENERELIKSQLIQQGWLYSFNSDNPNRFVNPKGISFIKREERIKNGKKKYRIILNLNSSISLNADVYVKTSDAVYFDFFDKEEMDSTFERFMKSLNTTKIS